MAEYSQYSEHFTNVLEVISENQGISLLGGIVNDRANDPSWVDRLPLARINHDDGYAITTEPFVTVRREVVLCAYSDIPCYKVEELNLAFSSIFELYENAYRARNDVDKPWRFEDRDTTYSGNTPPYRFPTLKLGQISFRDQIGVITTKRTLTHKDTFASYFDKSKQDQLELPKLDRSDRPVVQDTVITMFPSRDFAIAHMSKPSPGLLVDRKSLTDVVPNAPLPSIINFLPK